MKQVQGVEDVEICSNLWPVLLESSISSIYLF